jgi:pathogenesis-related protein 1
MRRVAWSLVLVASCSTKATPTTAEPTPRVEQPRPIAKPPRTKPPRERPVKPRPARAPKSTTEVGALAGTTAAHNDVRAAVGVAALEWSNDLAAHAQTWANRIAASGCQLEHRTDDPYGENLFWASGGAKTPAQVVGLWASEQASYDHASNRCARGQVCGHYTQIVWRATKRVGCGRASCGNGEVWVCNYDPPGNFTGQSPY